MNDQPFGMLPIDPRQLDATLTPRATAMDVARAICRGIEPVANAPLGIRIRIDGPLITVRDPQGHIMWSSTHAPCVGEVLACHECRVAYRLLGGAFSLEARVDERPKFVVDFGFVDESQRMSRFDLPNGWPLR